MSAVEKLKVEFAAPKAGSTVVKLTCGEESYQFFPSYTPYDSFGELVTALLRIINGERDALVRWNVQRDEHKFVFTSDGERVEFKVYEIIDSVVGWSVDDEKFSFAGSLYEVLRPFWKAVRDMQSKQTLVEYKEQWRRDFPEQEVTELTLKIKRLKNVAFPGFQNGVRFVP
jgi:hypothetical protein